MGTKKDPSFPPKFLTWLKKVYACSDTNLKGKKKKKKKSGDCARCQKLTWSYFLFFWFWKCVF